MASSTITLGQFLRSRRMNAPKKLTIRDMASELKVAIGYYCDLENDRRMPSDSLDLGRLAELLMLSEEDRNRLYDLAASRIGAVPADIRDTMFNTESGDYARAALRLTNEGYASEDDWKKFIWMLEERKKREG